MTRNADRGARNQERPIGVAVHRSLFLLLLLAAGSAHAAITFVAPLEGAQVVGPQFIEIATDVANIDRVEFQVDGVLAGVARQAPYRIAYDFGIAAAPRTVTAKVLSHGYRTSEVATLAIAGLTANETVNVDLVEVPIGIRSAREVKPSDLRILENGVEQRINHVRRERPSAHFAFVLDRSLSMGDGKLAASLAAIERALSHLREGDTASLVVFNHRVESARKITARTNLGSLLGQMHPSGGTSLRDALSAVASSQRTYAIAITDGGDRNSELSDEAALRAISGTRTIVNAIVLGDSQVRFLDRATGNTGGSVVRATRDSVGQVLESMLIDINSRHLVIYQSSGVQRGWRKVEVRAQRRGVGVANGRKEYFAE